MRLDTFEALAPICPRCLHTDGIEAPLKLASTYQARSDLVWQGMIHCSNTDCWMEFPIIDGIPALVPDPKTFLQNARHHILLRDDLDADLTGLLTDALGQGSELETTRQHLGLYAGSHFSDWVPGEDGAAQIPAILDTGWAEMQQAPDGPAIDLGTSVGRGVWEMAARRPGPVLGADLNFSMLRMAQTLMLEGRVTFPRRRVGIVYDTVEAVLPADRVSDQIDFWALDAMALPFRTGQFATATAVNLVDCISGPTNMIAEASRILAPGARAMLTTPYDWSATVTDPVGWMGGHSQRGVVGGAAEPVLTATLTQYGLNPVAESHDVPWLLNVHARSVMHYALHLVVAERTSGTA